MTGAEVLKQQIRFALESLKARNGHHTFEHLCRAYARERFCTNILPATGPVSAGGDGGSDFETFPIFTVRDGHRTYKFACTLTQSSELPTKIRSDVTKIASEGSVDHVYVLCGDDLAVGRRKPLISWAHRQHKIELTIVDREALAEDLTDAGLYWIAREHLALPASHVVLGLEEATPSPPRTAGALLGRVDDLARASAAFAVGERQVVLVSGPPGVGKTKFALALCEAVAAQFPDGQVLDD